MERHEQRTSWCAPLHARTRWLPTRRYLGAQRLSRARSIITSRTMKLPEAYDVLGVQEGATVEEAKRAYKKLALLHPPDRSQDPDATEKMQRISAPAFRTLPLLSGTRLVEFLTYGSHLARSYCARTAEATTEGHWHLIADRDGE